MSGQSSEPVWSVDGMDDDFILEEDDSFGLGDIEDGAALSEPPEPEMALDAPFEMEEAPPPPAIQDSDLLDAPPHDATPYAHMPDDQVIQPIPRITIHASCDRPEIARMIEAAAGDRRMQRAEVTVEEGGVEAALVRFASQASPNLLIIDTTAPGAQMLRNLDRLAQVVEEGTKVVIIGAVNDIALFRELMSRGVSEYIVPPVQPLHIIKTISGLYANPDKPFAGRLVAVIGARGGVGASTIAHNLAWSIAERQDAGATLMDLDLSFGTAALDFNQEAQQSIADALLAPDRVDDVFLERIVTKQTPRLQILTAPATLEREFELDPHAFELVIDAVRRSGPFVVLDLPHAWSSWIRQTLFAADDVIIVASPDLASLRNAKNIIDLMKASRPYDTPPQVILNMVGVPKRPEIPAKDFAEALGAEPAEVFMFDPALFGTAANNGQMLGEAAPTAKTAIAIDQFAARLTGRRVAEPKKAGLAARLPFLKR
ncbi:MAG: AAA family ATPase [Alphaproteobacteria bacterium]|nr:AAA family ATPase [Alphaproteobacteria bacterium]